METRGYKQELNESQWDEQTRRAMLATGVLFILTFITSIVGLLLYGPVLDDSTYVLGTSHDTRIAFGALCEVGLVITNIGTAIALYPVMKRYSETISLAYVASRIFESTIIAVGMVALLSVVTLRQDFVGADATQAASLVTAAAALVAIHDWTFLFGPAFCAGFGNGILVGYLMYKSGIMPRRLAILGLVAGPLALATAVAVLFGAYEQTSLPSFIVTVPEIAWESIIGIYLTVKALRLGRGAGAVGLRAESAGGGLAATSPNA
ncbi:MAG: DUF4386 domain-containing protein [Tepidiformaceae bacterium]